MKNNEESLKLKAEENYRNFLHFKNNLIKFYLNNIGLKINIPLCMIGKLTTKTDVGVIKDVDIDSGIVIIDIHNSDLEVTWSVLTDVIEEYGML